MRALDLGEGATDGGYDGVWERLADEVSWRVEVKSNRAWSNLRRDIKAHLEKYEDRPTLVVCRLPLTEDQRTNLLALRESPQVELHDGSAVAGWLRDYPAVADAWGFGLPVGVLPPSRYLSRVRSRSRLLSEERAAEAAFELLAETGLLVLRSQRFGRSEVALRALIEMAALKGDPAHRMPFIVEAADAEALTPAQLERLLQRPGPDRTRVFLPDARPELVDRFSALPGLAVVTCSRSQGSSLRRVATLHQHRYREVAVAAPTAAERRLLAQEVAGREGLEVDSAAVWWKDPSLVEAWLKDPVALEAEIASRLGTAANIAVAGWLAVRGVLSEVGETHPRFLPPTLGPALRHLEGVGLIEAGSEGWQPVSDPMRSALVRVWIGDDGFSPGSLRLALMELGDDELSTCLAGLWTGAVPGEEGGPRACVAELLGDLPVGRRRDLLRRVPDVFAASADRLLEAIEWALDEPSYPARVLLSLLHGVQCQSTVAPVAMGILLDSRLAERKAEDLRRLSGRLVHPRHGIGAETAVRVIESVGLVLAVEPTPGVVAHILVGILEVWLAADVEYRRSWATGWAFGATQWRTGLDSVRDGFRAARGLLVAGLRHRDEHIRDAAWTALGQAGRGRRVESAPEELAVEIRAALREAAAALPTLDSPLERLTRQEQLFFAARSGWAKEDDETLEAVAGAMARDVRGRLAQCIVSPLIVPPDPTTLRAAVHDLPRQRQWRAATDEDDAALAAFLDTNPGPADVVEILGLAGQLASSPQVTLTRGLVVSRLAERRPELVEAVLFEHRYFCLEPSAQRLLLDAAACVFSERVRGWLVSREATEGVLRQLARFLAAPCEMDGETAGAMTWLLRRVVPDQLALTYLASLARGHQPPMRQIVEWWLLDWLERNGTDAPEVHIVVGALVAPPHGFAQLVEMGVTVKHREQIEVPPRSALESVLLDALEAHVAGIDASEKPLRWGDYAAHGIRPLMGRLLHRRPAQWWRVAPVIWGLRWKDTELVLGNADDDAIVAALLLGPAVPASLSAEASLTEAAVRKLDSARFGEALQCLLAAGDDLRARSWMIARGIEADTLELFLAVADRVPDEDRARFGERVASATGLAGFGAPMAFAVRPFEEPEQITPPAIVAILQEAVQNGTDAQKTVLRAAIDGILEDVQVQNRIIRRPWPD